MILNLAAAIFILVLGVAVTLGAGHLGQGLTYNEPGPGFFPRLIGIGLIICGAVEAFLMLRQHRQKAPDRGEASLRGWGLLLVLGAYVLSWGKAHYVISTGVFLFVVSWFLGARRWVGSLAISTALAAIFFTLFSISLKIPLP
jgi:putative tricarboxylic transport membrane protein